MPPTPPCSEEDQRCRLHCATPWHKLCGLLCLMLVVAGFVPFSLQAQTHFTDCPSRTGNSAILIIPSDAVGQTGTWQLEQDDEIAVFTPQGQCAGAAVWQGENMALTIWGDDAMTQARDGLRTGEDMALRIWDVSEETELQLADSPLEIRLSREAEYLQAERTYRPNGVYLIEALQALADK